MTEIKAAYPGEFLRCTVGSNVTGLNTGSGDLDQMGVLIEGPEKVIGLGQFEQHTWRSQPDGVPSGPGDLDLTVYGLRKFMRLAVKGNPSILMLFFVPKEFRVIDSLFADDLRSMTSSVVSKQAASPFLGYLTAQKQRLLGERGGRRVRRPELVGHFGYDSKYCSHMVRLGIQGIELLETGSITLPMPEKDREYCLAVRKGEIELDEILTRTGLLEQELADLKHSSPLQESPDVDAVNDFLYHTYTSAWNK